MCGYSQTKLLQIYATRELASLLPPSRTGVVINHVSPRLCKTELVRHENTPPSLRLVVGAENKLSGRTADQGSRMILHAAQVEADSHGKYCSDGQIREDMFPAALTNEIRQMHQKRVMKYVFRDRRTNS